MPHGHVGPPIPGRHAYVLRNVVNAVDGAAFVATGDDQIAVHHVDEVRLPMTFDFSHVNLLLFDEAVNEAAFADGTGDDGANLLRLLLWHSSELNLRHRSRHLLYVIA